MDILVIYPELLEKILYCDGWVALKKSVMILQDFEKMVVCSLLAGTLAPA